MSLRRQSSFSRGLKSARQKFSFAPSGLAHFPRFTHGLRRGLHSCAAARLKRATVFHREGESLVFTHTLAPASFAALAAGLKPCPSQNHLVDKF